MGKSGGPSGAEKVNSEKARTQLKARKKSIEDSIIGKIPGVPNVAGGYSLNKQISDLDGEKNYAVAVPGTSFAAQGQAYTEAPGMKSDAEKASMGLAVGSGFGKMTASRPSGSIGKVSATKPPKGSGEGYVGDVAGVVKVGEMFGMETKTFTGKTGYSPSGQKIDSPKGGGGSASKPVAAPVAVDTTSPSTQLSAAAKAKLAQSGGSSTDRRLFGLA